MAGHSGFVKIGRKRAGGPPGRAKNAPGRAAVRAPQVLFFPVLAGSSGQRRRRVLSSIVVVPKRTRVRASRTRSASSEKAKSTGFSMSA